MKAPAKKKVQPKPPAGVDGVAVSAAARTAALAALYVAPENARSGGGSAPANHIEELAINIKEFGLLQPLVAYEDEHGRFAIADGGRRLRALQMLAEEDVLEKGGAADLAAIPLSLIDQSAARAASLAANTQRVDLGIVEAAEAWSAMALQGLDTPYIARVFGVTERFVDSRLALAGLHTPILEALRAGEISLDIAQIFATAKMARQEQVWKKLGGAKGPRSMSSWSVRGELKKDTLRQGEPLARFVGPEAYIAAGGVVERELFADAADSRWLNPDLARQLAIDKLDRAKAGLEAEGFLFVAVSPETDASDYVDGNLGKPRKPTAEEKARLGEIKARRKAIDAAREAIDAACEAQDRQYTAAEDQRIDALEEELGDLCAEEDRIEYGLASFDDAAKAKSGIEVTIDEDGALLIRRGVVEPKHRKTAKPGAAKKAAAKAGKHGTAAAEEPKADMTNPAHEGLSRIASVQVGRALAGNTPIALAALAASLARETFAFDTGYEPCGDEALTIHGAGEGGGELKRGDSSLADDKHHDALRKRWVVALGKKAIGWDEAIAAWPQSDVLDLIAFCVGESVKVIETNANREFDDYDARRRLAVLGRLAGAKPASFVAGVELLKNFSRPALDRAAAELGVDSAGAKNKVTLAAMVADRVAQAGWAPPLLRTLTGVEIALPAPAQPSSGVGKAGAAKAAAPATAPKKRGRPPGVKNGQGKGAKAKVKKPAKKAAPAAKGNGK